MAKRTASSVTPVIPLLLALDIAASTGSSESGTGTPLYEIVVFGQQGSDKTTSVEALRRHPKLALRNCGLGPWAIVEEFDPHLPNLVAHPAAGFDLTDPDAGDAACTAGWIAWLRRGLGDIPAGPDS